MKKFLLIWMALNLALGPVAGAFASPMPYMAGSDSAEHCMGHEAAGGQDIKMDCCDSEYDQNQCCDHCVGSVSGLLNTGLPPVLNGNPDPAIAFALTVLSTTHSPPDRPPRA